MDNFFSSYSLLHSLLEKGIYATGTLRPNRKHFPRDLIDVVKKGQNGNITVTVWQDKKPVVVISSQHNPCVTATLKRKKSTGKRIDVVCPQALYGTRPKSVRKVR